MKSSTDSDDFDSRPDNEDAVVPTYVPPKKKVEEPKEKQSEKVEPPVEKAACKELVQKDVIAQSPDSARMPEPPKENLKPAEPEPVKPVEENLAESVEGTSAGPVEEKPAESKPQIEPAAEPAAESGKEKLAESGKEKLAESKPAATPADSTSENKKEKRSLTETEFWTIILTPEFDDTVFWALKKWSLSLLSLFRVQFKDCFVEGFRGEYLHMGYGAALNGFLKGYPYIGDWDFRMDWTYDHEPRTAGQVVASVNICRVMGLFLATVFYGGVIAFKFWRRRAHVLKTNELPELGWIRTKIVKMMAEE